MAMTDYVPVLVHTGYANGNKNWKINVYVCYKFEQDIVNNRSKIITGMYVETIGCSIGAWTDHYGSYVGTPDLTFDGNIPNFSGIMWLTENKEFWVNHNDEGVGFATIAWHWGVNSSWGRVQNPSGTFTVALPTIARASYIDTIADVELGENCNLSWKPASSAFTYKLKFSLGKWNYTSELISPQTTNMFSYTGYIIPLEVAEQLPDTTEGTMTASLYTYSGDTQIGSTTTKNFNVHIPESVVPIIQTLTAEVINDNVTIQNWNIAVAGFSRVKLAATAKGVYGSTVKVFSISGGYNTIKLGSSLNFTGDVIGSSGNVGFAVVARDSRGRTSVQSVTDDITFYAYAKPKVDSFIVSRSESNAMDVSLKANWHLSELGGKNSATAILYYKKSNSAVWTTSDVVITNGSVVTVPNVPEDNSYNFRIIVTDALGLSGQEEGFVSTIQVLLYLRAGGKGLGIGKIAESDSLEVGLDTIFFGDVYIQTDFNTRVSLAQYIRDVVNATN